MILKLTRREDIVARFIGELQMFERDHRLHYANRAAHAAGLGDRARNPKIAALHHELARLYWIFAARADRPRSDLMTVGDEGRDDPPAPIKTRFGRGNIERQHEVALG